MWRRSPTSSRRCRKGGPRFAITGISMTPEREQLVDFTHPYFNAGLRILTRGQAAGTSVFSIITNVFSPALL
jgi:ABC-type amino acid transport substrate-binding protein